MSRTAPDPLLARVAGEPHASALQARSASWTRVELLRAADGLAAALLAENPSPTRDEVQRALAGNLCRCTGYEGIFRALIEEPER